jgi:hypothetical protein
MDDDLYTCEDCDTDHPLDHGYLSEAGFECDTCHDKRMDREAEEYRHWAATSTEAIIRRNYPDLDRHAAMSKADPVGFYFACKNGTIE